MQNLKTILGYYDFGDTPKTIVYPIETNFTTTIVHEFAHKVLNDRTILGLNIKFFKEQSEKVPQNVKPLLIDLTNLLIKETEFVQEGFATYVEYQGYKSDSKNKNSIDSFLTPCLRKDITVLLLRRHY